MNEYISCFPKHLKEACKIGRDSHLKMSGKKIQNVVICGLGGSGIGGNIVADIVSAKSSVPILSVKNYLIPGFINENTLVIANSYSGNTEETLSALKKCKEKNAEIAIITSGGKLEKIADEYGYNHIIIPSGQPPRAMLGYSFVQIFYLLNHYNIIDDQFKADLTSSIKLLDSKQDVIKSKALSLAKKIFGTTPVIYVSDGFEGVATRFRQQINENSKMLGWHHVIPEMNHNELLGWRTNTEKLSVIYFRNTLDYKKNQARIDINKGIIEKFTTNITEMWSEGRSLIETSLYHINIGDWTSWYLSEMNNVDAIEIDVINYLKKEIGKI